MSSEVTIFSTCKFGRVDENSKTYDISKEPGKKILDYRISKIKCQTKSNDAIYGIQFIYRNINTNEEVALINVIPKELNLIEQEMSFDIEDLVDLRIWVSDDIRLRGFEVTTNKGRTKKFGYGNDEELIKVPDFEDKVNTIVGFGVCADDKYGVTALYAFYLNKKTYAFCLYLGIFGLRIKLRNEEYKRKCKSQLSNMKEKNKILFRVCSLPDNQFFNIIKYAI